MKRSDFHRIITFQTVTAISCMAQTSSISDFIFPPGRNMFEQGDLRAAKFDRCRVNNCVFIPYLIHLDHTTRKLEIVAYSEAKDADACLTQVRMGARLSEGNRPLLFADHPKHPCHWARYVVWDDLKDSELNSFIEGQHIVVEARVKVGNLARTLQFRLEQRVRSYSK